MTTDNYSAPSLYRHLLDQNIFLAVSKGGGTMSGHMN
jgi:hypothetical protein